MGVYHHDNKWSCLGVARQVQFHIMALKNDCSNDATSKEARAEVAAEKRRAYIRKYRKEHTRDKLSPEQLAARRAYAAAYQRKLHTQLSTKRLTRMAAKGESPGAKEFQMWVRLVSRWVGAESAAMMPSMAPADAAMTTLGARREKQRVHHARHTAKYRSELTAYERARMDKVRAVRDASPERQAQQAEKARRKALGMSYAAVKQKYDEKYGVGAFRELRNHESWRRRLAKKKLDATPTLA